MLSTLLAPTMISAQVNSFERCIPELAEIFPRHHAELALFKDRMPLDPQYAEYVRRERAGNLFLVTVRKDGKIVAYQTVQCAPGFHYGGTLTGTTDIVYVVPEERGHGLALPLYRHVEQELRRRGAAVFYSGYKSHNPLGMPELLKKFGFIPADSYMAKWIGNDQA